MNETDERKIREQRILTAYTNQIKLHLSLINKSWRNGYVKELGNSFFIFEDDENGKEAIFYLELKKVQPFMKNQNKEEG